VFVVRTKCSERGLSHSGTASKKGRVGISDPQELPDPGSNLPQPISEEATPGLGSAPIEPLTLGRLRRSGDVFEAFRATTWNGRRLSVVHTNGPKDSAVLATERSWSNHGPRISASRYLIRFWEPPASRIFNQLSIDRVLSQLEQSDSDPYDKTSPPTA
jgi:hypothetical protein